MFTAEDRVSVKFSDFYNIMKEATKGELMTNAVNADVPHVHIRGMLTGKKEEDVLSITVPVRTVMDSMADKMAEIFSECNGDEGAEEEHGNKDKD